MLDQLPKVVAKHAGAANGARGNHEMRWHADPTWNGNDIDHGKQDDHEDEDDECDRIKDVVDIELSHAQTASCSVDGHALAAACDDATADDSCERPWRKQLSGAHDGALSEQTTRASGPCYLRRQRRATALDPPMSKHRQFREVYFGDLVTA